MVASIIPVLKRVYCSIQTNSIKSPCTLCQVLCIEHKALRDTGFSFCVTARLCPGRSRIIPCPVTYKRHQGFEPRTLPGLHLARRWTVSNVPQVTSNYAAYRRRLFFMQAASLCIYTFECCLVILFIHLKPGVLPPAPDARNRRRTAPHAVIQNQLTRIRVGPDEIFKERYRLLCGMEPTLTFDLQQLARVMHNTGFRVMRQATVHLVNRVTARRLVLATVFYRLVKDYDALWVIRRRAFVEYADFFNTAQRLFFGIGKPRSHVFIPVPAIPE